MTGQEIATIITAERALAGKSTKQKAKRRAKRRAAKNPDEYRRQHGKCPQGFRHDPEADKCVRHTPEDSQEPREQEQPDPSTKEAEEPGKSRDKAPDGSDDTRESFQRKGFRRYRAKIDKLRREGKLPDEETSKLLVQIDNPGDLPEEVKRDKGALRETIKQQEALRVHQDRVLRKQLSNIQEYERKVERAKDLGEAPPKFSVLEMLRDIEEYQGAPVGVPEAEVDKLQDAINRSATRPGSRTFKLRDWLDSWVRIPKWRTKAEVTGRRDMSWPLGFPPYDQGRVPRRHIPNESSGRPGFPPYGEDVEPPGWRTGDKPDPVVGPGLFQPDEKMRGFPPYVSDGPDRAPQGPRHTDNVGLPPYNNPLGRPSYVKPDSEQAPGFPPYNKVPRYEALRDGHDLNPRDA